MSGLVRGLLAGILMAVYLVMMGVLAGMNAAEVLRAFIPELIIHPDGYLSAFQGLFVHLSISVVYGAVYGLLSRWQPKRMPGWLSGLLFGAILLLLAQRLILPTSGSGLSHTPIQHLVIAHLVYGLALGVGTRSGER